MSRQWVVTGTSMVVEADDQNAAVDRAQESSGWNWEATPWHAQDRPPSPEQVAAETRMDRLLPEYLAEARGANGTDDDRMICPLEVVTTRCVRYLLEFQGPTTHATVVYESDGEPVMVVLDTYGWGTHTARVVTDRRDVAGLVAALENAPVG